MQKTHRKAGTRRRANDQSPRQAHGNVSEGLKDTTESIVVAFILAFVFRTFMIEAFVIPTGSMAATLYGKHGAVVCEDCGWENTYGLTDQASRSARYGPHDKVRCQNCDHLNTNLQIHDGATRRIRHGQRPHGNAESGDRILVFKWPFDFGADVLGPQRWDVTVFKNPANGDENFIKRLLGLPDEVLEILDGDIYRVPIEELSEATRRALENLRRTKYRLRTADGQGPTGYSLRQPVPQPVLDELSGKLHICRKPQEPQKALWGVVYDHDYPPYEWDSGQPRWRPGPGGGSTWTTDRRQLTFSGASGGRATVTYDVDDGKPIVDHNVYNIDVPPRVWNPVSDLRLEAVLYLKDGDGDLEITLPKRDHDFIVTLRANGRITLERSGLNQPRRALLCETLVAPFSSERPVEIAFQNVDYRVSVEIDRREVMATTPEQYSPDITALRNSRPPRTRPPSMTATDIDLELWHVVLLRDTYYTSPTFEKSQIAHWAHQGWGTTNYPILLREGEYFMLGDNSPASKDSRLWDQVGPHMLERGEDFQLGTVPADQLIGRAFFVYWPSGLRPDWLGWVPKLGDFGLVPNFGRMRWIR